MRQLVWVVLLLGGVALAGESARFGRYVLIDSQKADVEARQFAAENHITAVVPTEHHIAVFYCADDSTPHVQVGKMVEKGPPAVMLWCSPEKK